MDKATFDGSRLVIEAYLFFYRFYLMRVYAALPSALSSWISWVPEALSRSPRHRRGKAAAVRAPPA